MSNTESGLNVQNIKLKMQYGSITREFDITGLYNSLPPAKNGGVWWPVEISHENEIGEIIKGDLFNVNDLHTYRTAVMDGIKEVLDASIVNEKQKKAICRLILDVLISRTNILYPVTNETVVL